MENGKAEAHNLIRPPAGADFGACRERLASATESVVVLFTATPVLTGARGMEEALGIFELAQGNANASGGSEGYVSWFMQRPPSIFATVNQPTSRLRHTDPFHDGGRADNPEAEALMPNIYPVVIDQMASRLFWEAYVQRRLGTSPGARSYGARLGREGGCVADVEGRGPACVASLAAYEHTLSGGIPKEEQKLLAGLNLDNAQQAAPKLSAIALSVSQTPLKTLVLIHDENGPAILVKLLELYGLSPVRLRRVEAGKPGLRTRAENRIALRAFNAADNIHGKKHRVDVASAQEFSEGVSFMQTRRVILADLSPGLERPSWALVKQRVGRALRSCSHHVLPVHIRTLQVDLYVVVHERPATHPLTIDLEKLLLVQEEVPAVETAMEFLHGHSIDGSAYYQSAAPPRRANDSRAIDWNYFGPARSPVDVLLGRR